MSGAQSISTRRAYGVQRVCRVWHRARSSVYARRQATRSPAGIVKLTLLPAQCRDEHSPAPLPSASLSARNHQPCRLALPQILHELPGC